MPPFRNWYHPLRFVDIATNRGSLASIRLQEAAPHESHSKGTVLGTESIPRNPAVTTLGHLLEKLAMVPLQNRTLRLTLALIGAFLLVLPLSQSSFAQAPGKDDSYVTGASPSLNNGSATSLVVQAGSSPSYTYIRFDLSRIPTGGTAGSITSAMVQKATLRVFVTAVTAAGSFDVFEVGGNSSTQNWSEATITYTSQSSYTLYKLLASGIPISYTSHSSKNQ